MIISGTDNEHLAQIRAAGWKVTEFDMEPSINCPVCTISESGEMHGRVTNQKPLEAFTVLFAEGADKDGNERRLATAYDRFSARGALRNFACKVLFEAVQSLFE